MWTKHTAQHDVLATRIVASFQMMTATATAMLCFKVQLLETFGHCTERQTHLRMKATSIDLVHVRNPLRQEEESCLGSAHGRLTGKNTGHKVDHAGICNLQFPMTLPSSSYTLV